jgi:hypothetical protein
MKISLDIKVEIDTNDLRDKSMLEQLARLADEISASIARSESQQDEN